MFWRVTPKKSMGAPPPFFFFFFSVINQYLLAILASNTKYNECSEPKYGEKRLTRGLITQSMYVTDKLKQKKKPFSQFEERLVPYSNSML